eukprot:m51a1_g3692 hypothetical protein (195) ;mRNA; f:354496-355306
MEWCTPTLVTPSSVFRGIPFQGATQVTLTAPKTWLEGLGVTPACVRTAGLGATLQIEPSLRVANQPSELQPCSKCCAPRGKPNIAISGEMCTSDGSSAAETAFTFFRCVSYCNSSRLHLGGRVCIVMTITAEDGRFAARVTSEPLSMLSAAAQSSRAAKAAAAAAPAEDSGAQGERKDRRRERRQARGGLLQQS